MTPLEQIIRAEITARGPMPFSSYMDLCLMHPQHGYYMVRDPLGMTGDFTTSPEISQLFGEMVALWCINAWQKMGAPQRFALLECGPGRGTLMADVLRTAKIMPGFLDAASVILVEKSPVLKAKQQETLRPYAVEWRDDIKTLPVLPIIMFCNEFFDAFPVQRFVKTNNGWEEQCVIVEDKKLVLTPLPPGGAGGGDARETDKFLPASPPLPPPEGRGIFRETSPAITTWMDGFAAHLMRQGGAALIVDYAYEGPVQADTVQAVRGHKYADLLDLPGECDITAHVDYTALRQAAHGLNAHPVISQRDFLLRYGIEDRLARLKAAATPEQVAKLESGAARLINEDAMGTLFKVLCLAHPSLPALL